ncbi:MAG TPA: helix-turn-helix domain-containing protein [Candidatus Baltobacteraceae bacterium]|jgi:AraC-like DNA-binding protein|nr:helix-turn-helix domain-containing protein [Candidatus Baltobacteraceae bacterium]
MTTNFVETDAQSKNDSVHRENKDLVEALANSTIYQDYERAFSETTGLPVSIRSVESWQLPHRGKRQENPFCAMMAGKSRSCAACLRLQQQLSETAQNEPQTLTCELGLSDTAVPIRFGERLVGFLQTGQVFRKKPTEKQFDRAALQVAQWELEIANDQLRQAYFSTKVLSPRQHDGVVRLLAIFGQHISMVSNQILVQRASAEPPSIARAKQFIQENQAEVLSLGMVAKAVNMSTFYFCKMFKKATGLNFTDYVSRVRVEKARNLLLNRNLRISEIAYEIGFQSLTHFNRVFKKITGQSPTEYRSQLAAG